MGGNQGIQTHRWETPSPLPSSLPEWRRDKNCATLHPMADDVSRGISELTMGELGQLIRDIVRDELERVLPAPKPAVPVGAADTHAAAKHFKVTHTTVRNWIMEGGAPAIEVEPNRAGHRQWRVELEQLDAWVRGGGPEALDRKIKARPKMTPEEHAKWLEESNERARRKGYKDLADWLSSGRRA